MNHYSAVQPPSVVPVGRVWAAFEWKWFRVYGWIGAAIRRAADFIGYSDILPIGQALRPWYAARLYEQDYFTPAPEKALERRHKRSI